jgi:predicted acyl esterase
LKGRHRKLVLLALVGLSLPALTWAKQPPQSSPSEPVYEFEVTQDWLTMSDGVRLSVTFFKPVPQRPGERFPILFELLPYRKDDRFYARDYPLYSYFARRGYVVAKVDIRGTGSSEGKVRARGD